MRRRIIIELVDNGLIITDLGEDWHRPNAPESRTVCHTKDEAMQRVGCLLDKAARPWPWPFPCPVLGAK